MIRNTLQELTALRGISGREEAVRTYILQAVEGRCQSCVVDNLGNVLVTVQGAARPAKKLVFSAHMDEVGFVITRIEEDGSLRFAAVGGVMPAVALARPVEVGADALPGVIGAKPIHHLTAEEKEKYPPLDDMRIDIGAKDRADAEKLVKPGDMATFWSPYRPMGDDRFCVRAIDDRAGCALMLELILGPELAYDCTFAFTVQEENGCIGSKAAAFALAPDIAIVAEGTTASDIPDVSGAKRVCTVGKGPVVSHMDGGTLYDMELCGRAGKLAEANDIPWQTKELVAGGNDSRSYLQTGAGSRVMAVSIPVRYIHSATSVASWQDIENAEKLLRLLVAELLA